MACRRSPPVARRMLLVGAFLVSGWLGSGSPGLSVLSAATAQLVEGPGARVPAGRLAPEDRDGGVDGGVGVVIRGLLDHSDQFGSERAELVALYDAPGGQVLRPLWCDARGVPGTDAREALSILSRASDDGLNPADYDAAPLEALASALGEPVRDTGGAIVRVETAARFDVMLSGATLRYLRHAHSGRVDPRRIGFRLHVPNDRHDFAALLRAAVEAHRVAALVEAYRPPLAEYRELRAALARYRAISPDAWAEMPQALPRAVRVGDRYEAAPAVRRRLMATGDLASAEQEVPEPLIYDSRLASAVARYQTRHGLDADGVIGTATMAAFNVPLAWRVRQLELALERQRWLPHVGGQRLVVINIPMFTLWAWDEIPPRGTPAFTTGVIVGRALNSQTPVFASQIREVVFQPYWNVPRSILRDETLPALVKDPAYLEKEDMEIVRGDGDDAAVVPLTAETLSALRRGALRVRQRPGPRNALGRIKFVFPNQEDVYMHGTPARELFARYRRDFSHGCVRLADPVGLAEWVFAGQRGWDRDRIQALSVQPPASRHVALAWPVDVVLFYSTAGVSPTDGSVRFASDIYQQDVRLDRALATPISRER